MASPLVTPLTPANAAAEQAERELQAAAAQPLSPWGRWQALAPRRRWMLAAGIAGLIALLVVMAMAGRRQAYAPLFPGAVSDKDAGAAVAQLKTLEVPYRIEGQGVIQVPADKADELRMKLAAQGLPKGTVNGFELLDNPRFGQSPQQERTSLQRALEGELTRSIQTLSAVQSARVHLALPRVEGFYREQSKPSASVVVSLHPGRTLDRGQIAGIVHLVASSVPDMKPRAVSVIDQDGSLLSGSEGEGENTQDLTQQQRLHVQLLERKLLDRVNEILEPALGRDNLRATVTADVDFNQVETTAEAYKPNQGADAAAAVRSQRTLEAPGSDSSAPAGVPGAASNQPPTPASAPITGPAPALSAGANVKSNVSGRRESQTNYEVDRRVDVTRHALGALKRVNVAVLVNHRENKDAKGKTSVQPVPQEELDKLTALVQEAVGFNKDRGDSVKVVSIPFRAAPKPEEPPLWQQPWVQDLVKTTALPLAALLIGALLVFAVIRPAMKKPEAKSEPGAGLDAVVGGPEALPGPDGEVADTDNRDPDSPEKLRILADARVMARDNPVAVANILRGWMSGDEPKKSGTRS